MIYNCDTIQLCNGSFAVRDYVNNLAFGSRNDNIDSRLSYCYGTALDDLAFEIKRDSAE